MGPPATFLLVTPRPATAPSAGRRRRSDGELTRRKVIEATVESILESGYYHTSSNEIARRAGVTWGTIQHQFGSREALLLAVINDSWADLQHSLENAEIEGESLEERLAAVLDVLSMHYGTPQHLAHLEILLDLIQNPTTSAETRQAAVEHGRGLTRAWRPLFASALGEAAGEDDLVVYAFKVLRGYLTGELIAARINPGRRTRRERDLLVRGVAAAIREDADARGVGVD